MKRVIIAAVILWVILIFFSYRATCQDSVKVYVIGLKGQVTLFQMELKQSQSDNDVMILREVIKYNGSYFINVSSRKDYEPFPVCFSVWYPAPLNLSAARKARAYVIESPFLIQ